MKPLLAGALALLVSAMSIFAQGSLTPPAAPAPTMKTLDQVKPGFPIDPSKAGFTTPYTISSPGNYYLTGNIAVTSGDAIDITTNGVTLDLNGFTISSTASPIGGNAILVNENLSSVTILNGHITGNVTLSNTGSGFTYGIKGDAAIMHTPANDVRVAGISVFGCSNGILLGRASTLVESCQVYTTGVSGIFAGIVKNSSASVCGGTAISGNEVADSEGDSNNSFSGISAQVVHNSAGSSGGGTGISASIAENCNGSTGSPSGFGLSVFISATNCFGSNTSGGSGISLSGGGSLNGCLAAGKISAGDYCPLTACRAAGIIAGQGCTLTNCVAQSSSGNGITVGIGSTVTNCSAGNNSGIGIVLSDKCVAQDCNASGNTGDGITLTVNCNVLNSNACGNSGDGIHLLGLTNSNNRVDGNNASNNVGIGIHQTGGPDLIARNFARNNSSGTNYSPSSGTSVGPVGQPNTATSPWANFQ